MAGVVASSGGTAAPESEVTRDVRGWRQWLDRKAWRDMIIAVPYVWLLIFFLLPFIIVIVISLGTATIAQPPVEFDTEWPYITWDNYDLILSDSTYFNGYLNSLVFASIATFFCLLIGYPMALAIARADGWVRNLLLLLIILPFWTSFLLRIYAWIGLLSNNSWFNNLVTWVYNHTLGLGAPVESLQMMNTNGAVILGIVYSYLPFMILPLYATLEKLDRTLDEAAMDLGSRPIEVFRDITLPLSIPGIIAGGMLVFIPATGELVIPSLMGRADSPMIGRVINDEFALNRDWPVASAIAVALLLLLVVPIMIYNNFQSRADAAAER
jgi:putrescine transport system permease protein